MVWDVLAGKIVFRVGNSKSANFSSFCLSFCELRRCYQRSMRLCDCVLLCGGCVFVQGLTTNSWCSALGKRLAQPTYQCSLLFLLKDNACTSKMWSQDSIISKETRSRAVRHNNCFSSSGRDKGFLSFPKRPYRLCSPSSLLLNGYRRIFLGN
jgi:hypothetical protein